MDSGYVLGIDYGSDSARALLVAVADGREYSSAVCNYQRWKKGLYCDAAKNQFRQHPQDYIDTLETIIAECLKNAPQSCREQIIGISINTTGSTPVAVNSAGTPLALTGEFSENPNAMFILWKDHTAIREAEEINHYARTWGGEDFTKYSGGAYSSEWFWAKILHVLRIDEKIRDATFSWVEHSDWMPALLTGNTNPLKLKRSRCSAGHKAMWHASWGGLPPEEFWGGIDPLLSGLRKNLYSQTFTSDISAGALSKEWAERLNLPAGIPVGVGAIDAHMGAVGAKIGPGTIVKVIGTSTCDMAVIENDKLGDNVIEGICGQVDGSILPGYAGLEAGQSAFGDLYAWYRKLLNWPLEAVLADDPELSQEVKDKLVSKINDATLQKLNDAAEKISIDSDIPVALDWINGRRTPGADQSLKMAIAGISMGMDAPGIYRAIVEATAFGNRRIMEHLEENKVEIKEIVAVGGIARKAPFVMQVCADVLGKPISVAGSDQCCALGSAIFAAVMAGAYPSVAKAQEIMGTGIEQTFYPDMHMYKIYSARYKKYLALGTFAQSKVC